MIKSSEREVIEGKRKDKQDKRTIIILEVALLDLGVLQCPFVFVFPSYHPVSSLYCHWLLIVANLVKNVNITEIKSVVYQLSTKKCLL